MSVIDVVLTFVGLGGWVFLGGCHVGHRWTTRMLRPHGECHQYHRACDPCFPPAVDTMILDAVAAWATPEDTQVLRTAFLSKPGGAPLAAALEERFERFLTLERAKSAAATAYTQTAPMRTYEEAERDASGEPVRKDER